MRNRMGPLDEQSVKKEMVRDQFKGVGVVCTEHRTGRGALKHLPTMRTPENERKKHIWMK